MTEALTAFVLVFANMWTGAVVVIPIPYSSEELCVAAMHEIAPKRERDTFLCVPVEDQKRNRGVAY